MAKQTKKTKQVRNGTLVAAWMTDDELIRIDEMVNKLRLDRSNVIKLFTKLYTPDELLARYVSNLTGDA